MLHVHMSERVDALVEPLAHLLSTPADDPLAAEVVAVPTRGVERWLAQRLSHVLGSVPGEAGVCANVAFPSPSRLVADVLAALATDGAPAAPTEDPWRPDRLVWRLLDVVDGCSGEPWCRPLGRHLGAAADERRRGRRLAVVRHLVDLFTSYGTQRPALMPAWLAGDDVDGAGGRVPEDLAWQPELWRRLRRAVGVPSPAERLEDALSRLRAPAAPSLPLPARVSVVGPTRLPEGHLRVLAALAATREVHLWLLHPSARLWQRTGQAPPPFPRRRERPATAANPLLASMARDATELQLRLHRLGTDGGAVHHPAPEPPATLLGALQRRLREDAPATAPPAHVLAEGDRTVQVHACHGRARQVEVLREVLVGLFADDPTLEPRDVVVLCPDVETVAPLLTATFGAVPDDEAATHPPHPGRSLRVRLADRSLRRTNPLLEVLARLLELADGRVTASDVLDLAATAPVRRRFRLGDDDLERVRGWVVDAGVRWGEDRARRSRFGLDRVGQGTWEAGLDRVLLGVAVAEEEHRYLGTALPLDDVDSTDVDLVGRLAELLDRLGAVLASLDGARPVGHWLAALERALDLLAEAPADQPWQEVQARAVLAAEQAAAGPGTAGTGSDRGTDPGAAGPGGDVVLRLPDVRALLADRLAGRPTRAGFRTGALTVCSLVPMRAVPHRVVALLGMDDGTFPRVSASDGDDLLLREPLLGERDRRSEDRQLFLDAVTAAIDHLVVLHTGADERTGAPRPPAVPVGELLDALDATATTPDGGPVRERVVLRHPLQPVDERNFVAGALGRSGPFSADQAALAAALAGRSRAGASPAFLERPLPPVPWQATLELDDLVAVLEHPARALLRQRLGVRLRGSEDDVEDRLPLELGPLEKWAVGDRMLTAALAGAQPREVFAAERRRGTVPPGELGGRVLQEVGAGVDPVAAAVAPFMAVPGRGVDVTADLPDGRAVTGTVPGVHGDVVVRAVYSRLGPKHRLRAWVQLLALAVADPGRRWAAVTVGRSQGRTPSAQVSRLTSPPPAVAERRLAELAALRDAALREPLPLPVGAAAAYGRARSAGDQVVQALEAARREWDRDAEFPDADRDVVHGRQAPFAVLLAPPSREEAAWWPEEGTRLGVLARRVWEPLLGHEEALTA